MVPGDVWLFYCLIYGDAIRKRDADLLTLIDAAHSKWTIYSVPRVCTINIQQIPAPGTRQHCEIWEPRVSVYSEQGRRRSAGTTNTTLRKDVHPAGGELSTLRIFTREKKTFKCGSWLWLAQGPDRLPPYDPTSAHVNWTIPSAADVFTVCAFFLSRLG